MYVRTEEEFWFWEAEAQSIFTCFSSLPDVIFNFCCDQHYDYELIFCLGCSIESLESLL